MSVHAKEKPFNCEICLKAFPSKNVLARHIKVHTREKPYSCENCSKVFPEKGHLATHMRVHTKEKPYSYEVCNKAFSHKSNLVIHMRVHTKEKPFETKALLQKRHAFTQRRHLVGNANCIEEHVLSKRSTLSLNIFGEELPEILVDIIFRFMLCTWCLPDVNNAEPVVSNWNLETIWEFRSYRNSSCMPRNYVRKTQRAAVPLDVMKRAADAFIAGASLRETIGIQAHIPSSNGERYVARVDIVDGNELEGVFMKKTSGHRLEEEKPAFIIDQSDEASFHKQDVLKVLPAPKNMRGSLRKSNQLVFPCDLKRFNLS
ncbi:zinc finger protein 271-like [Penaeus indicus]|uniref:zinc finger protein 271-like n=1 Tax=Penaeus indicus TaxID=29960 RepID=UPI00300C26D9